jgi:hypothetical protein
MGNVDAMSILAPLRHAGRLWKCLLSGVDRK